MGKVRIGSAVVTHLNATDVIDSADKRDKTPQEYADMYDVRPVPYSFLLHKPGSVTSNGTIRNIYPIQPF